ncbi:MAG: GTPase [Phycisphaerales bacterium JB039]
MTVGWRLLTPAGRAGAIGALAMQGDSGAELDAALAVLGLRAAPGQAQFCDLAGVDQGLICRPAANLAILTPHGGVAILRRLLERLEAAGISAAPGPVDWPEATDAVELRLLEILPGVRSPLAIGLLLDQPRRWRERPHDVVDAAIAGLLHRLLRPPTVAIVGAPNIGKSALLNALARRAVSVVADEPGTTRDHVGALVECAGLVVRLLDAPGERAGAGAVEAAAQALARDAIAQADLRLLCVDAASGPLAGRIQAQDLVVATRRDRGAPAGPVDVQTSALTGAGLPELARGIRDRLVPPEALGDPRPWRFWEGPGAVGAGGVAPAPG